MGIDGDVPSKKPMGCHHEIPGAKVIQALKMLLKKRL